MVLLVVAVLAAYAWHGAPAIGRARRSDRRDLHSETRMVFPRTVSVAEVLPGKWEVVGAMVVPGLAAGFLALLPWIDRGPDRDPRQRRVIVSAVAIGLVSVIALTTLGGAIGRCQPPLAMPGRFAKSADACLRSG